MKNGTVGTLRLEMIRGEGLWGGGGPDFLVGEETPQGHYVNKAGKFLYLAEKQLHKV